MATYNKSFAGLVTSPNTVDVYLPFSTIGGVTEYYGNGFKWNGSQWIEESTYNSGNEFNFVDITSIVTSVASPAVNDVINPTGVTVTRANTQVIKYASTGTNKWKCGTPP